MKVDNDDIWNNYIKTGELKGFSIDGMVELEEVTLKSNIQMSKNNKNILALLKQIVSGAEQEVEVTLGSVKSGELDIQFDGETLEVGAPVFLLADEEKVSLADGTYKIDEGGEIVVKDGLVESMSEAEAEEEVAPEAEEVVEAELEEEVIEEVNADEESMKVIKEILDDMFKAYAESMEIKMSALDAKLETLTSENVELKEQVVTLSAQPSVEPVSSQPKQVKLTKQGRILEAIKLANQNK